MKKPKLELDQPQPRKVVRADKAPTEGYSLVVDGHFKSHHDTVEAAELTDVVTNRKVYRVSVNVHPLVLRR